MCFGLIHLVGMYCLSLTQESFSFLLSTAQWALSPKCSLSPYFLLACFVYCCRVLWVMFHEEVWSLGVFDFHPPIGFPGEWGWLLSWQGRFQQFAESIQGTRVLRSTLQYQVVSVLIVGHSRLTMRVCARQTSPLDPRHWQTKTTTVLQPLGQIGVRPPCQIRFMRQPRSTINLIKPRHSPTQRLNK